MESLISSGIQNILPVISPTQNLVKDIVLKHNFSSPFNIYFGVQDLQLGTGHAVQCGLKEIIHLFQNNIPSNLKILVAYGDTPCVKSETFRRLMNQHEEQKSNFTILAFHAVNPFGYGRILLDKENQFDSIREQKDCTEEEQKIQVCNSGILCANYADLISILPLLDNKNSAKEYYLTDVPFYAKKKGLKVGLMIEKDESQFLGINTQEQLFEMENKLK